MKIKEEDLRRELEVALSGKDSQPRCSARLGMRLNRFKQLLRRARIHGIDAVLHSNMAGSYTDEFKLIVVNSVINESLTLGSAGARYNLAECTIKAWVGKYQEGGEEAILENGRGRQFHPPLIIFSLLILRSCNILSSFIIKKVLKSNHSLNFLLVLHFQCS